MSGESLSIKNISLATSGESEEVLHWLDLKKQKDERKREKRKKKMEKD